MPAPFGYHRIESYDARLFFSLRPDFNRRSLDLGLNKDGGARKGTKSWRRLLQGDVVTEAHAQAPIFILETCFQ
jgi:hypothetical protein